MFLLNLKREISIWKLLLKDQKFMETIANLGLFSSPMKEICNALERSVCVMYGDKKYDGLDQLHAKLLVKNLSTG